MKTRKMYAAGALLCTAMLTLALSASAEDILVNFDTSVGETLPADFSVALTGAGGPVAWVIKDDATAPSGSRVLAQTSADQTNDRFPLCIYEKFSARDVEVAITFKAVAGRVDQAAGLVARFNDEKNYYIVRANALENNVRLYKVVQGVRTQFAGANIQVSSCAWQRLKLVVQGTHFKVFFDDRLMYTAHDETFKGPGKVGLWTKADSVTYFDDLSIISHNSH